jgi:general secretion pathway protein G
MKPSHRTRVVRHAFTLLEVLMVIVILGVLAALIVPQFTGTRERAMTDTAKIQIAGLDSDLERFKIHCGRFPTSDEGLAALLEKPDDEGIAEKWAGPYLKKAPKDPWGHDLIYVCPGEVNENGYDLSSAGPNGQEGDDDDITNWEKT